jgi:hypothetical protein
MGRHSLYTPEIAETIIERLTDGESLRAICDDDGMPSIGSVIRWARDDLEGFSARYARAREAGYVVLAEEVIAISDDGSRDYTRDKDGREVPDHDHINRSRLRVDSRKWLLSKMLPKVYGDKIDLNHGGEVSIRDRPDDQLESRVADLLRKAGIAGNPGGEDPS